MKTPITIISILIFIVNVQAQNQNFKHFEIDASIMFWTPNSMHLESTNSVTQYAYPTGVYVSSGLLSGYGSSITPELNINYYFQNKLGISLGFSHVNMDNELFVQETDTTSSNYENQASIDQFTLGIVGQIESSSTFRFYYGVGINFVANYDLEMQFSSESSDPPDLEAIDSAIGFYMRTGLKIKLYKFVSLNTSLEYSYVPVELEYTNSEGSTKINEDTNLGGLGLKTGLSFKF